MIKRYQIQDIVAQDASGIVFQAVDTVTQQVVAVRRFFPFGADGEGLQGEEQIAYDIAISRLADIRHPGLRGVVSGGCDPVDGMPFIATEWIEGETLGILSQGQPLSLKDVIHVITRALEVSELLSAVLSEEGIWVETELDSIVVGRPDGRRGVTFWISPLKWLGRSEVDRDLDSIITLTERLMGWQGQVVKDDSGRGLGGWLNWLRGVSATTSLNEAREMLAAATGLEPPPPTQQLVRQATRPLVPTGSAKARKKFIPGPLGTIIVLCLVSAGLIGWMLFRGDSAAPWARGGLAQLAAELAAEDAARQSAKIDDSLHPGQLETLATTDRIFAAGDPQLLQLGDKEVVVEGAFRKIDYSPSKDFMYLLLADGNAARGSIPVTKAGPGLKERDLSRLIGKKIRVRGKLTVQQESGLQRPDVTLTDRAAIEVVE